MRPDAPTNQDWKIGGYGPGHPWYYVLGGRPLTLKQIRESVMAKGYRGYMATNINLIDSKAEPRRSEELRRLRLSFFDNLKHDVSGYRRAARELHRYRENEDREAIPECCDAAHTSVSLKHNHLFNDFAHIILLDELLFRQGDLFGY
jgi:hypothetical protein